MTDENRYVDNKGNEFVPVDAPASNRCRTCAFASLSEACRSVRCSSGFRADGRQVIWVARPRTATVTDPNPL